VFERCCAVGLRDQLKKVGVFVLIYLLIYDQSLRIAFVLGVGNSIYYISSGGFYMMDFYKEIAEKMKQN